MGGQDGVVRLYHSGGDLRSRVDGELQLGLLAIVHRQTLHQQRGEARTGSTTKAVEHQETLETCALVSQFANSVQNKINELFANSVVTTGVVIGSIFLSCDELLRVEQLTVCTSAHLINDSGLQIYKHSPGDMLSSSGLTEEGVEGVITSSNGLVAGHLPIRLDAVLKTIEFPAGIADLDSSLTNVDRDALTLNWVNHFSVLGWSCS